MTELDRLRGSHKVTAFWEEWAATLLVTPLYSKLWFSRQFKPQHRRLIRSARGRGRHIGLRLVFCP